MYNSKEPEHPGKEFAKYLDKKRIAIQELSYKTHISEQTFLNIINKKAPITLELATLLSMVFNDKTPISWIKEQALWDRWFINNNESWRSDLLSSHNKYAGKAESIKEAIRKAYKNPSSYIE